MSNPHQPLWVRRTAWALVVAFLSAICPLPAGASTAEALEELKRAEGLFQSARYAGAYDITDQLVRAGGLDGADLRGAYVLRARCQVQLGRTEAAVESFCQALAIEPAWRPVPGFYTTREMNLFEEAHAACSSDGRPQSAPPGSAWYAKPWVWIAGGAAVVGVAIVALAGGDGDGSPEEPLPEFPNPPGS